jgi:hypothetical protein
MPVPEPRGVDKRIELLTQLMDPQAQADCMPRPGESRLEGFLRGQNLGTAEVIRSGIQDPARGRFGDLLKTIAATNLNALIADPGLFSGLFDDAVFEALVSRAVTTWPRLAMAHIDKLDACVGIDLVSLVLSGAPELFTEVNITMDELAALNRSGETGGSVARLVGPHACRRPEFWTPLATLVEGWKLPPTDAVRDTVHAGMRRQIALVDELVATGVISRKLVLKSLDTTVQGDGDGVFRGGKTWLDVTVAAFLLRRFGRDVFPSGDPTEASLSFLSRQLTNNSDVSSYEVHLALWRLYTARAITESERQALLLDVPTPTAESKGTVRIARHTDVTAPWTKYADYRIVADVSETEIPDWKAVAQAGLHRDTANAPGTPARELGALRMGSLSSILGDTSLTQEERTFLVSLWFKGWPVIALEFESQRVGEALAAWPPLQETVAVFAARMSTSELARTWPGWSGLLGITRAQARAIVERALETNEHAALAAHTILTEARNESRPPLLTENQAVSAVIKAMSLARSGINDYAEIYRLSRVISERSTVRLLNALQRRHGPGVVRMIDPRLMHLIDIDAHVLQCLKHSGYHQNLALIIEFPNLWPVLKRETAFAIADWAAENLTAADAAGGHASYIWSHLTSEQLEKMIGKIFANPSRAELMLAGDSWFASQCRLYLGRQLPEKAQTLADLETSQAFKTHSRMVRRSPKPGVHVQALMGQMAYTEQLTGQVRDGHQELVRHLAALTKARNPGEETRRLEVAALMATGAYTAPLSMDDAKEQAWRNATAKLGLAPDTAGRLLKRLQRDNVDALKVATWLLRIKSDPKSFAYAMRFFRSYAGGITEISWKRRDMGAVSRLPAAFTDRWFSNNSRRFQVDGQTYQLRFTHRLNSVIDIGEKPMVSCLHYGAGTRSHALAGFFSPEVKVLEVLNPAGKRVANAVVRLAPGSKSAILLEPVYTSSNDEKLVARIHLKMLQELEHLRGDTGAIDIGLMRRDDHTLLRKNTERAYGFYTTSRRYRIPASKAPLGYDDVFGVTGKDRMISPVLVLPNLDGAPLTQERTRWVAATLSATV